MFELGVPECPAAIAVTGRAHEGPNHVDNVIVTISERGSCEAVLTDVEHSGMALVTRRAVMPRRAGPKDNSPKSLDPVVDNWLT